MQDFGSGGGSKWSRNLKLNVATKIEENSKKLSDFSCEESICTNFIKVAYIFTVFVIFSSFSFFSPFPPFFLFSRPFFGVGWDGGGGHPCVRH